MTKKDIGVGIDLGSSAVRVGIYNILNDDLIDVVSRAVAYKDWGSGRVTQSSEEIMDAISYCFQELCIDKDHIVSCGIAATCSMAIFRREQEKLLPLNIYGVESSNTQNVIFWMDNMSKEDCELLNNQSIREKLFMGGSFIPEMGIPKLMNLNKSWKPSTAEEALEVFDLHKYIAYALATKFRWDTSHLINVSNTNGVGHDGEISGWSEEFYRDIIKMTTDIEVGPTSVITTGCSVKVASCIDCYSSWFSVFPTLPESSLFMVAGTSTCYLYATSKLTDTIPGVWGPFTNIIDGKDNQVWQIYQAGQSTTGLLIDHLFNTHPAAVSSNLSSLQLFAKVEETIRQVEKQSGQSIHFQAKHKFTYGELSGNRTPYCDPSITGMFIGETTDKSFVDFVLKYITVLEFLAFQARQIIGYFEGNIDELRIVGSQAGNIRLLSLISFVNDEIPIKIPIENVSLMGVRGAYLMGKAAAKNKTIFDVVKKQHYATATVEKAELMSFGKDQEALRRLLLTKYEIFLDMAETQQKYHTMINKLGI